MTDIEDIADVLGYGDPWSVISESWSRMKERSYRRQTERRNEWRRQKAERIAAGIQRPEPSRADVAAMRAEWARCKMTVVEAALKFGMSKSYIYKTIRRGS